MKVILHHGWLNILISAVGLSVLTFAIAYLAIATTNNIYAPVFVGIILLIVLGNWRLACSPPMALYFGIFLYLFPSGLRTETLDFAYTVEMNGMLLIALLTWLWSSYKGRSPIYINEVYLLVGAFILWAAVTLAWCPDLVLARKELVSFALLLTVLFLTLQYVRTRNALDELMNVVAAVGWCVVGLGVFSLLQSDYHFGERLKILDMNENQFAYYCTMTLPGVIWPVLRAEGRRRLHLLAVSCLFIALSLVLVLATGSRGGTLSFVVMLVALLRWKALRVWGLIGIAVSILALISAPFLLDSLFNRADDRWGNEFGARDLLWKASAKFIEDHFLMGGGIGNGSRALAPYINAETPEFMHRDDLASHNPLLEVGVDAGIIGMIIWSSFGLAAIVQFLRTRRRWRGRKILESYHPLITVSAIAYLFSFMKDGGMSSHPTFALLLLFLTIPTGLRNYDDDDSTPNEDSFVERPAAVQRPKPFRATFEIGGGQAGRRGPGERQSRWQQMLTASTLTSRHSQAAIEQQKH